MGMKSFRVEKKIVYVPIIVFIKQARYRYSQNSIINIQKTCHWKPQGQLIRTNLVLDGESHRLQETEFIHSLTESPSEENLARYIAPWSPYEKMLNWGPKAPLQTGRKRQCWRDQFKGQSELFSWDHGPHKDKGTSSQWITRPSKQKRKKEIQTLVKTSKSWNKRWWLTPFGAFRQKKLLFKWLS